MKRWQLLVVLIFMQSVLAFAWEKSKFDISDINKVNSLKKTNNLMYQGSQVDNTLSEFTLIQGCYFTIGTNDGISTSRLDDKCGVTFGHPFALTSYPIFSIDGEWTTVESFFNIYESDVVQQGESLMLEYSNYNSIKFRFEMQQNDNGESISITSTIENLDTKSHKFGLGLIFDPGLGKKGDGYIKINNQTIHRDTILVDESIPDNLIINERTGKVDGMKASLNYLENKPHKLILANWKDIYQNESADFALSELRKLYDIVIQLMWNEQTINAGSQLSRTISLNLEEPDFSSPLFMRWDLPSFLSIENNLLFPRSLNSYAEITNLTVQLQNNCDVIIKFPNELYNNVSSYQVSIPNNETVYQPVAIKSKEIFEDKIVDISMELHHKGQVVDYINRNVFIPTTPLSDTGLVCNIDTVITSNLPEVKFTFDAIVEKTGQRLLNLANENIFLYENQTRINSFEFGKDTTGGVSSADIIFVLDVTGSMSNEIDQVKDNIIEFTDSLEVRGVDYQLGLVCFLDFIENVYDFTKDPQLFKSYVAAQHAHGGGDGPENSLDALFRATQFSFRESSNRVIIWITDISYHESDNVTSRNKQEVIDQLLFHDIKVHAIGPPRYQTDWYNPIIEPTGGNFYNIYGNFRDILLDISRMRGLSKYMITYTSPSELAGINNITLEIHYAGLGGFGYAEYERPTSSQKKMINALQCYPNPFNPSTQIKINLNEILTGDVEIYNILGRRVCSFPLKNSGNTHIIKWNARDMYNQEVAAGTYFVRLNLIDQSGKIAKTEMTKILYLK